MSTTEFVGEQPIKDFKQLGGSLPNLADFPFPLDIANASLKRFGVSSFKWSDVPSLLKDEAFEKLQTIDRNKELIQHFQALHRDGRVAEINEMNLSTWNFILDHTLKLRTPKELFFTAPEEIIDDETGLNFIHPELENWAIQTPDLKSWLEDLGVIEKSDTSFLIKKIIPNAETIITTENAVNTIRNIFNLFEKGAIGKDIVKKLGKLKLLTTTGNLVPAENAYLSADFNLRMPLDGVISDDIFVDRSYITSPKQVDNWRGFLVIWEYKRTFQLLNIQKSALMKLKVLVLLKFTLTNLDIITIRFLLVISEV
ncbi:hypothetical protein OKW96_11770 [Sphingobacterium sp. KU25419]|nr:hypothetical protein OKW96_11770 [Sphingobacterium sp. KU25419]